MTQTLANIFGRSVSVSGSLVTFDLADFEDSNGNPILADPANATNNQKIACVIAGIHANSKPSTDENGLVVADKTDVLVSSDSFAPKTFEVRQDESQVKHEFIFSVYTVDSTIFDPDNAI